MNLLLILLTVSSKCLKDETTVEFQEMLEDKRLMFNQSIESITRMPDFKADMIGGICKKILKTLHESRGYINRINFVPDHSKLDSERLKTDVYRILENIVILSDLIDSIHGPQVIEEIQLKKYRVELVKWCLMFSQKMNLYNQSTAERILASYSKLTKSSTPRSDL
ncbi:hypothetical protein ACOME3_008458 [Neoechinorhynchus agilis]